MSVRTILATALALLLGGSAVVGVNLLMGGSVNSSERETITVVVATTNISRATKITEAIMAAIGTSWPPLAGISVLKTTWRRQPKERTAGSALSQWPP